MSICEPFSRRSSNPLSATVEGIRVTSETTVGFDVQAPARALVEARQARRSLAAFPGPLPPDMATAYAVQDETLKLWPDAVVGWKVGRIPEQLQKELRADRVAGPVFARGLWQAASEPTTLVVIKGGFAAVEAEYIYQLGEDAPPNRDSWTPQDALMLVEDQLVGVEYAGSPLADINILGPKAVASAFGNNAGLIVGPSVPDWRRRSDDGPVCEAEIDGAFVGRGAPSSIPGGPAASLAFLLGVCAARGHPLKRGQLVSTGAASGIHDIRAGQTARITFHGLAEIRCVAVEA
jgi:2-keto-4-pentenoate hydratase